MEIALRQIPYKYLQNQALSELFPKIRRMATPIKAPKVEITSMGRLTEGQHEVKKITNGSFI